MISCLIYYIYIYIYIYIYTHTHKLCWCVNCILTFYAKYQDLSATSEFDPNGLSQLTPMSTLKNVGHSNNLEVLNQVKPASSIVQCGQLSEAPIAETTHSKLDAAHVVVISDGHNEITPAKSSTSKRAKLIKQEKKWNALLWTIFFFVICFMTLFWRFLIDFVPTIVLCLTKFL